MKICPKCGGTNVRMFDADNDQCTDCDEWFPAVPEVEEVYCHECSAAAGGHAPVHHVGPPCSQSKEEVKKPRLFYHEESENAYCPVVENMDWAIDIDSLEDGETVDIRFKRLDMTDEEFDALPEG